VYKCIDSPGLRLENRNTIFLGWMTNSLLNSIRLFNSTNINAHTRTRFSASPVHLTKSQHISPWFCLMESFDVFLGLPDGCLLKESCNKILHARLFPTRYDQSNSDEQGRVQCKPGWIIVSSPSEFSPPLQYQTSYRGTVVGANLCVRGPLEAKGKGIWGEGAAGMNAYSVQKHYFLATVFC
jgi:hypothetical protein